MERMAGVNPSFWHGRRVFVTGHTGFKGGWLTTWLLEMGAHVTGYSLPPNTRPCYFDRCDLQHRMTSVLGRIENGTALERAITACAPEVVFHLAAQSLVRRSYQIPSATFSVNVMGTVNLLEAVRRVDCVRSIIVVTSDKCYYPTASTDGYKEGDRLGGRDPYSASKACAEIATMAYAQSYLDFRRSPTGTATVRAGNVIGGGDWAEDRIVPDAIRAFEQGEPLLVRSPQAVRPWQHVLEPLSGYMMLAERLYKDGAKWTGAWNFGPNVENEINVGRLADIIVAHWGTGFWRHAPDPDASRETACLRLNSAKAKRELGWRPSLTIDDAVRLSLNWYRGRSCTDKGDWYAFSANQIQDYLRFAAICPQSASWEK
ncbi:MAG: CDP-glucose 4,6-dehydratase [Candidatus Binataceae bacterium]